MTKKSPKIKPLVSVIIGTYNGKQWLKKNLLALLKQTITMEIIIIDNNSQDATICYIQSKFPNVKLIALRKNYGFAKAINIGAKQAKGKYLFIENADMFIEKNYLKKLVAIMEKKSSIGAVQGTIYNYERHQQIQATGMLLHTSGFIISNYRYSSLYQKKIKQIIAGDALLVRKSILNQIGGYDENYNLYFEDIDFGWRIWLAGYQIYYEPKATMFHKTSGTTQQFHSEFIYQHTLKNCLYTFIKNLNNYNLIKVMLIRFVYSICLIGFFLTKGRLDLIKATLTAWFWTIINLPKIYPMRKYVQHTRKISDRDLFQRVSQPLTLKYLYDVKTPRLKSRGFFYL